MAEPGGRYEIASGSDWGELTLAVEVGGAIVEPSSVFGIPITGRYDAATGSIAFTTAVQPGEILLSSAYSGRALRDHEGRIWAFVGAAETVVFLKADSDWQTQRTQNGWLAYALREDETPGAGPRRPRRP